VRLAALSLGLVAALALGVGNRPADAASATAHVLVRPDPRMCPSPRCGGAWVRRVNHATTRCADGAARAECYVTSVDGPQPQPRRGVPFLARGRIVPARIEGYPGLGSLAVDAAWRPAGPRAPRGTTYRVADNGIRCITTPCFTLTAAPLDRAGRVTLSDLDLRGVGAAKADLERALAAIDGRGALVTGTVRAVPDAGPAGTGRTLVATQVWLPAAS
jgi:hypothetical protein